MRNFSYYLMTVLIVCSINAFAQQFPDQQIARQQFRTLEKSRFEKQLPYLDWQVTANQVEFDIEFYLLNIQLWPDEELLEASVVIEGKSLTSSLDHLEIDLLANMVVDSVFQSGLSAVFSHSSDILDIQLLNPIGLDEPFSIEVFYHGNPQSGGLGTWGWDEHQGAPIIWTLSQPYGAPAWWPCKDDPADKADSVFLNVTVPNDLVVASNGILVAVIPAGDRHTYSWETRYPISTYLVSLAISNYVTFEDTYISQSGESMDLVYYVYPEHLAAAEEDFTVTPDMLNAFASRFGEYPFIQEKYGMAVFPWGGAMEHQTMTSYGAPLITGDHTYDWINAHELAHQWFGDCITMKYWSHIWLNEGFSSYAEALWQEEINGTESYRDWLISQDPGSFDGMLWVEDSLNANALFSTTVYDKGSWVLHMLRGVLQDEPFFESLSSYATDPSFAYGNATTEDFRGICESVTGTDLEWFFEQWVYRAGRPNYVYNWDSEGASPPYLTTLEIIQTNSEPYKMPVQIRLEGIGLDTVFTVWDSLAVQVFEFSTDILPTGLQLDPDNWILKYSTEGQLNAASGQIVDAADSLGVADAILYWEGPYDTLTGIPIDFGIDTTDAQGNFEVLLTTGDHAFQALKDGYLASELYFSHIDGPITDLVLSLSQPEAAIVPDSLFIELEAGESIDTLMVVSNTGSGDMFVEIVEGNFTETIYSGHSRGSLRHPLPLNSDLAARSVPGSAEYNPVDSLWRQIHHDVQENPSNPYDLENTLIQQEGNLIYLRFTTYQQPESYNDMNLIIFLDPDHDSMTGLPAFGMGTDFLIAIGEFGSGYDGFVLQWNDGIGDFIFTGFIDVLDANPVEQHITVGIDASTLGHPEVLRIFAYGFKRSDLIGTLDYLPAFSLGYLSASLIDVPWLNVSPLFDMANADSAAGFSITIDPQNIAPGYHLSGLTVHSSHAGGMQQHYIPIVLDYATDITLDQPKTPKRFELSPNFPNPFNPTTVIRYTLPVNGSVQLEIYNVAGQRIKTAINEQRSAGYHQYVWDGSNDSGEPVASGVYIYRLTAITQQSTANNPFSMARKMILLR